jgi:hypothetical protein
MNINKMDINIGYIYIIKNKINSQIYIGSTQNNINIRWMQHRYAFKQNIKNKLYDAFRELLIENFYIEILEQVKYKNIYELRCRENYYISLYNSLKNGYNSIKSYSKKKDILFDKIENKKIDYIEDEIIKLNNRIEELKDELKKELKKELEKNFIRMNKEEKERMKNETIEIKESLFIKYLNETEENVMKEEYKYIRDNLLELNLINENREVLEKYKKIIMYDKEKNKYLDIIQIFNTKNHNNVKIKEIEKFSYKIKYYKSINQKVRVIKDLEEEIKLKIFDIEKFNDKEFQNKQVIIPNDLYKQIQLIFDTKRTIPKTMNDIGILYRFILKSLFEKEIFNIKKVRGEHKYTLNKDYIKYYIELYKYKNPKEENIDNELLKIIE